MEQLRLTLTPDELANIKDFKPRNPLGYGERQLLKMIKLVDKADSLGRPH